MGRPETIAFRIDGTIQSVQPFENADLDFSLTSDDPAILGNAYASRYFNRFPFYADGRLRCPRIGHYDISNFSARYGSSDIAGSVTLDLTRDKPDIR